MQARRPAANDDDDDDEEDEDEDEDEETATTRKHVACPVMYFLALVAPSHPLSLLAFWCFVVVSM